jgi:hypothetical protein
VVVLVTGAQMASQWHSVLSACTADDSCSSLANSLSLGNHGAYDLTFFTLLVPAVLGLLVGAPLVAGEIETGTGNFAWTQSVTRGRWLMAKAGWLLLAAAVWGGCISALVTWWSGPRNALYGNALQPNDFDVQGIVPVGYALFGMALGIAAGAPTTAKPANTTFPVMLAMNTRPRDRMDTASTRPVVNVMISSRPGSGPNRGWASSVRPSP